MEKPKISISVYLAMMNSNYKMHLYNFIKSSAHISDRRLLIFRSSLRADMAVPGLLPPRMFLDKFSKEPI